MNPLASLPAEFRETAKFVRENARAEGAACAWESAATRIEGALADSDLEPLSLEAAAIEGGYTIKHLRRLIKEGTVPNSAAPGEPPMILRRHRPRKPGYDVADHCLTDASSRVQVARDVAQEGTDNAA